MSSANYFTQFYCAICGGPFRDGVHTFLPRQDKRHSPEHDENADNNTTQSNVFDEFHKPRHCDTNIIRYEDLRWLYDLRLIGRNQRTNKYFITGTGTAENYLVALVDPGDDENVPKKPRDPFGNLMSNVYYKKEWSPIHVDGNARFPMHMNCLAIWEKAFQLRHGKDAAAQIHKGLLYRAMGGDTYRSWGSSLGERYFFEFQHLFEQRFWQGTQGFEVWTTIYRLKYMNADQTSSRFCAIHFIYPV